MSAKLEAAHQVLKNAQPSFIASGWTLVRNEDIAALREALAEVKQTVQQPLTDEQWLKRWTRESGQRLKPGPERDRLLRVFRFAWRAAQVPGKEGGAA